ncbi:MAG: radical SAM protein, partial [Verrucomicrobia bacterium]|nr:radical SAM protein [Verrucomicrobiota bacterium]
DFRRIGRPGRRIYEAPSSGSIAGLQPDRSIFRGKSYAPISLVQFGRGCRYNCDFCSIRAFYGSRLRQRNVDDVIADILAAGRSHVFLVDDNIFVDSEQARELFRALIPLKISWSCQVSIDIARDPELMELLRQSGCATAVVGFESLHSDNLRQMKKAWNLKSGYGDSIRTLQDAGIMIYGTFVFGYDGDTAASFETTVEFAIEHKFYLANFNPLTPTPGAPLMARLQKENRLLHERWWLDPQFRYGDATFTPLGMSPEDLTRGCYQARTRFNTLSSIISRFWHPRTHLRSPKRIGIYLASNFITRREIHHKQGRPLGDPDPGQDLPLTAAAAFKNLSP